MFVALELVLVLSEDLRVCLDGISYTAGNLWFLRTFALIVCAQPFCAGNATVICHASLRLTGPEDKHGVENAGEKISGRVYSFGSSVTPIFLIMNHLLYLLSTKYDKMKKISP